MATCSQQRPLSARAAGWAAALWRPEVLILTAAWVWLMTLDLLTPAQEDTARNLLMAADCLADDACLLSGPTSSFLRLKQGGVFVELLAAARALGLTIPTTVALLGGLFAAATALVFHATARAVDDSAAWAAAALWLAVGVWTFYFPVVDLPVALPLPLAVAWTGALGMARGGTTRAALLAGLGGALALNVHLVVGLWLVGVAALIVVAAARPWRALAVFSATVAATSVLVSVDAVLYDLEVVEELGSLLAIAAIGVLSIAAAAAGRRHWPLLAPVSRVTLAATVLGPLYVGVLVGLGLTFDKPLAPQFWGPAVAPVALLFGVGLARLLPERRVRLALLVAALGLCHAYAEELLDSDRAPVDEYTWSLADAETAAAWLYSGDWTYQDLFGRLQGPNATRLLGALAPYERERRCQAARRGDDLLVIRTERAATVGLDLGTAIRLPLGEDVAIVRPLRSWLRRDQLVTCSQPVAGGERRCVDTPLTGDHVTGCAGRAWTDRAYPHVPALSQGLLAGLDPRTAPVRITFSVPIAPTGGTARLLRLAAPGCDDVCCWRITAIEGLPHEQLPEHEGVLVRSAAGASGGLHLSREFGGHCDSVLPHFPPDLVELEPNEGSLRALLKMRADPR